MNARWEGVFGVHMNEGQREGGAHVGGLMVA